VIQPVAGNGTGTRPLPSLGEDNGPGSSAVTGRRRPSSQKSSRYHVPDVESRHTSAPIAPLDEHAQHDGADPSRAIDQGGPAKSSARTSPVLATLTLGSAR
jgi:hypothetical protein